MKDIHLNRVEHPFGADGSHKICPGRHLPLICVCTGFERAGGDAAGW